MSAIDHMLRVVVWGNHRERRWDHPEFMKRGATFVSRCQVPGFALWEILKYPVAAPATSSKLDAELYACTPEALWWLDDEFCPGIDRINVLANMFGKYAPEAPHVERIITGQQCAWMHFFCHPIPKGAGKIGYIYDLPNEKFSRYRNQWEGI